MSDHLRAHDAALERLRLLHPRLIDLSLGRMQALLDRLGNPELRLAPVVHVAGTNGKGSTVAMIRAIGEAAGLGVHVFTSPHLVRFAERIRLSGRLIDEPALASILERVEEANAGAEITFFEITTAAALLAFSETPADLVILEVGLGGRYDATNVVPAPALSVIAPVDYDHQDFLGDELAKIAGEKAGVIKPGRPVVSARQAPEALAVIEAEAAACGAPLLLQGREFDGYPQAGRFAFQDAGGLLDLPPPALHGAHQFDNAAIAVAASLALGDPRITPAALAEGLVQARWPARMQRLTQGPFARRAAARGADLWLDGGHNPHAARALAATARTLQARDGRPLVVILGLLKRKDARGVFEALRDLDARFLTAGFGTETAATPEELAAAAREAGVPAEAAPGVAEALERALCVGGPAPHVIIWGSLHLAGEVLAAAPETYPT